MTSKYHTVEINLSDFTDAELRAELGEREQDLCAEGENVERLQEINRLRLLNQPYHRQLTDYCRDILGTTI
jgi:hypothetical protein